MGFAALTADLSYAPEACAQQLRSKIDAQVARSGGMGSETLVLSRRDSSRNELATKTPQALGTP
jgi:hypothetical protein